jgi:curved DNA-binding protein CbpA
LYEILGVDARASVSEIRQAHRRRARSSHPDLQRNADPEQAMVDINVAAWVLCDPELRLSYERHRRPPKVPESPWYQRPARGSDEWITPVAPPYEKPQGKEVMGLLHRIRDWPARVMLAVDEASVGMSTVQRTTLTATCLAAALVLIAYARPTSLTKLFQDDTTVELQK